MCRPDKDADRIKRKQTNVFRLSERDFDLNHVDVAEETGLHKNSIGIYARGESVMGFCSFYKLCHVIPARLLSIMLPRGFQLHRVPEEIEHDTVAALIARHTADLLEGKE